MFEPGREKKKPAGFSRGCACGGELGLTRDSKRSETESRPGGGGGAWGLGLA